MDEGDEWRLEALSRPPQLSPDGQWIAVSSKGQEIILIDVDQQIETRLLEPGAPLVAWSPNSQHLAYTSDYKSLSIYDVQEDKMIRFLENDGVSDISNIVWAPDSRIIAFGCCFVWGTTPGSSVNTGQIRTFDVFTNQMTVVGETWISIGGGSPELCWTSDGQVALIENTDRIVNCSYTPLSYKALSPDGQRQASLKNALPDDKYWTGPSLLTVHNLAGDLLWERRLEENVRLSTWSPNGQYILLDDDLQNHSPIWRMKADGTGEIEIVVEDGFLLNVIPAWQ
jgi:WD40 repeat protein